MKTASDIRKLVKYVTPAGNIRCGILGCGKIHNPEDSRIYRLTPTDPIPACPECWEGLGIPEDFTDTADYEAEYEAARNNPNPQPEAS